MSMTLEDFFTLTEIKDGLTATSRVEELVSVMQRNKDSVVNNAGDASRQWASVASTIAATKNKECLDVFMKLDGLLYFGRWLTDAQRLSNGSTDSSLEESIFALLQALDNLGVDRSRSIHSGVWHIIKNLLNHGSSRVRSLARTLFDSWKQDKVYKHFEHENESTTQLHEEEETRVVASNGESSGRIIEGNNGETCVEAKDEFGSPPSGNSERSKPDGNEGLAPEHEKLGVDSNAISNCHDTKAKSLDGASTNVQESFPGKEKCSTGDNASADNSSPLLPKQGSLEGPSDAPVDVELSRDDKQLGAHGSSENSGTAVDVASSSVGLVAISSDSAAPVKEEVKKEPFPQRSVDANDEKRNSSDPKCGLDGVSTTSNCSKDVLPLTYKNNKHDPDTLSGSSGEHCRNQKDETCSTTIDADVVVKKDDKGHANGKRRVKRRKHRNYRSTTVFQRLDAIDKTTADIEFGIVDALEVATKVAQEVAREVDSREPSFGSSEELSDESAQSDSPESVVGEQETPCSVSPSKEVPMGENHSGEASHRDQDHIMDSKENKSENGVNDNEIESSHVARQPEVRPGRSPCDFDLNQDVYSDETDLAMSSPSVLRPIAAPGVLATPLKLERTLCWTGSAATSAFRPASPHKVSGGDLKEKQAGLGIDLNVAEGGNDKFEDLTPRKLIPSSSNSRAAESSQEANRGESDRFNLDLNCANDGDDASPLSDLRMETRLCITRNGHQSASSASSSSAQPPLKKVNIDLNDGPQFLIDTHENQGPYYGRRLWRTTTPYWGHQSDEPVFSLFGTKVEVNKKVRAPPVSSLFPKGKSIESTLDLNMSRTGDALGLTPSISYQPSPIYGYNGLTAPPGTSLSLASPTCVPGTLIQHMMDSRGAPVNVMPQVIGTAPHIQQAYTRQQAYPHQQPFLMNMTGGSAGLDGSILLQPNYDRSSGFGLEIGNRDSLNLIQFLSPPGQGLPTGGQLGTNTAEASSGPSIVGVKRKEPETEWSPYPLSSRPQYPPWR